MRTRRRSLLFVAAAGFVASAAAGLVACGSSSSNDDGGGQAADDASAPDTAFATTSTAAAEVKCGRDASCAGDVRQCCSEALESSCVAPGSSCGKAFRFDCDGPEDCAPGQSCCEGSEKNEAPTSTTCQSAASCNGGNSYDLPYRVCHVDGECVGDERSHCCFSGINQVLLGTCQANPCP